jgi:hypothetical protein
MIVYKLDKTLDGQKILNDIQNLVNKIQPQNNQDYLLTISIKTITTTDTSHIKKLEYKKI